MINFAEIRGKSKNISWLLVMTADSKKASCVSLLEAKNCEIHEEETIKVATVVDTR